MTKNRTKQPSRINMFQRDYSTSVGHQQHQKIVENKQVETPVVDELIKASYEIEEISDLQTYYQTYATAIPILLHWLPLTENRNVKEEIVRALSVPWAKSLATPILIEEFKKFQTFEAAGLQWTIGNAISIVARLKK